MYKLLPYFIARFLAQLPITIALGVLYASPIYWLAGMPVGPFTLSTALCIGYSLAVVRVCLSVCPCPCLCPTDRVLIVRYSLFTLWLFGLSASCLSACV